MCDMNEYKMLTKKLALVFKCLKFPPQNNTHIICGGNVHNF